MVVCQMQYLIQKRLNIQIKKCVLIGENGFFAAKTRDGLINGAVLEGSLDGANSNSTTKISEYGNLEDIKSIHQNKFYHKLINEINKISNNCSNNTRIYFKKGKLSQYIGNSKKENNSKDKFIIMDGVYLWLSSDNGFQDIELISNITGEVNVLGYIIRDSNGVSPEIVKVLAIYIE